MCTSPTRILVADKLDRRGLDILEKGGLAVDVRTGLDEAALCRILPRYQGMIVRSAAQVTAPVIGAGTQLRVIGRAGVGVDNIDLAAATNAGIIVENTPTGNIASAAEHALAMLFACARNIARADHDMKAGRWSKKECTGVELGGKTLGVIGLGKVGNIVARVCRAIGMRVLVFDPYLTDHRAAELGVEKMALDGLLPEVDFLSVHAPATAETRNMIGLAQLRRLKPTCRLINAARGGIVNESELVQALRAGVIAGAALDVFDEEPLPAGSALRSLPNVVLTPHLGASTEEAQTRVAEDIASQFVEFFRDDTIRNAVNLDVRLNPRIAPYARLAGILGQMAAQIVERPVQTVEVSCCGHLAKEDTRELGYSALKGLLRHTTEQPVTLVNAPLLAEARGIELIENSRERSPNYANLVSVRIVTSQGEHVVAGTCFDGREARIVCIEGFFVDVKPAELLLLMFYPDKPGMIGTFGSILGRADINIANMAVGRREKRGRAAVVLTVDDPIDENVLTQIRNAVDVERLHAVELSL